MRVDAARRRLKQACEGRQVDAGRHRKTQTYVGRRRQMQIDAGRRRQMQADAAVELILQSIYPERCSLIVLSLPASTIEIPGNHLRLLEAIIMEQNELYDQYTPISVDRYIDISLNYIISDDILATYDITDLLERNPSDLTYPNSRPASSMLNTLMLINTKSAMAVFYLHNFVEFPTEKGDIKNSLERIEN